MNTSASSRLCLAARSAWINRSSRPRTKAVAACALLFTSAIPAFTSLAYGQVANLLTVDYIDVRQGESILLSASEIEKGAES